MFGYLCLLAVVSLGAAPAALGEALVGASDDSGIGGADQNSGMFLPFPEGRPTEDFEVTLLFSQSSSCFYFMSGTAKDPQL